MPDTLMINAAMSQNVMEGERLQYVSEEQAEARVNLAIQPHDTEWKERIKHFEDLLASSHMTIQDIISATFTYYESQLLIPGDRPSIKEVHTSNSARYHTLLQGRFSDIQPSLALKMTMLYFGLPIEPMTMPLDNLLKGFDRREPEGPRYDVDPPLHFLTAHNGRNWGKDYLRGQQAVSYPLPVSRVEEPMVSLRGGQPDEIVRLLESSSDGENDGFESEDESEVYEHESEETIDSYDKPSLPFSAKDEWVHLYGYQGCIPIVPTKWGTIASAMRKLLSIASDDNRELSFELVHFDKNDRHSRICTPDTLPLTKDSRSLSYLTDHFGQNSPDDHQNCCAFFVKKIDDKVPHDWEPEPTQFRTDVLKLSRPMFKGNTAESSALGHAYIAFPKSNEPFSINDFNSNEYESDLHTAINVLLGRPKDSGKFHHSFISIYNTSTFSSLNKKNRLNIHGSLPQSVKLWKSLYPFPNRGARWIVEEEAIPEEQVNFLLPHCHTITGLGHGIIPGSSGSNTNFLDEVWPKLDALLGDDAEKLQGIRISSISSTRGLNHDMLDSLLVPKGQVMLTPRALRQIRQFLKDEKEKTLVILPEWQAEESRASAEWSVADESQPTSAPSVPFPGMSSSLGKLRDCVENLSILTDFSPEGSPEKAILTIRPVYSQEQIDSNPYIERPVLSIDPEATDGEWRTIRSKIHTRNVTIDLKTKRDVSWIKKISKSNVWGPRYRKDLSNTENESAIGSSVTSNLQPINRPLLPSIWEEEESVDEHESQDHDEEIEHEAHGTEGPPQHIGGLATLETNERHRTWATQPSLFDGIGQNSRDFSDLQVPINAPPAEQILRTTSQVPMVSKAVLTPTEQAELQRRFWEVRNIALNRTVPCSYKDCMFTYRLDDEAAIETHLRLNHRAQKCMWCDDPLYEWWTDAQRNDHLRNKHNQQLVKALGQVPNPVQAAPQTSRAAQISTSVRQPGPIAAAPSDLLEHVFSWQKNLWRSAEPPRRLTIPLQHWYDLSGPNRNNRNDTQVCPVNLCPDPRIGNLGSLGVYLHIRDRHPQLLRECVFCNLPFQDRNNQDRPHEDIIRHLDCHVYGLWKTLPRIPQIQGVPSTGGALPLRCPLYIECGQIVNRYDWAQLLNHFREKHHRGNPRNAQVDQSSRGGTQHEDARASLRLPEPAVPNPPASLTRGVSAHITPEIQVEGVSSEQSGAGEGSGNLHRQEQEPAPEQQQLLQVPESHSENEPERGRTLQRASTERRTSTSGISTASSDDSLSGAYNRRDASPDWVERLGPGDPNFIPAKDMYCSKCLRKVPLNQSGGDDPSSMGLLDGMNLHSDKNRCCKIRNGEGVAENLPNRSGWIRKSKLPKNLGQIKEIFLSTYPAYRQTLYPLDPAHRYRSIWKSDPNNDSNQGLWDIPWPPYEGEPPFPGGWDAAVDEEENNDDDDGNERRAKHRKKNPKRKQRDQAYADESDEESSDSSDSDDSGSNKRKRGRSGLGSRSEGAADQESPKQPPKKKKKAGVEEELTTIGTTSRQTMPATRTAAQKKSQNKKKAKK